MKEACLIAVLLLSLGGTVYSLLNKSVGTMILFLLILIVAAVMKFA